MKDELRYVIVHTSVLIRVAWSYFNTFEINQRTVK